MTTDETGLAAALRVKDRDLKAGEPPDFDVLADTALAWVDARLADPATVEAVAEAIVAADDDAFADGREGATANDAATAALAAVRGLLGEADGEG